MTLPDSLKEYLHFSRRDRTGLIALLLLISLVYLIPFFFRRHGSFPLEARSELEAVIDSLSVNESRPALPNRAPTLARQSSSALFPFDPNSATAEEWQKLGLSEKTARTILRYREKGGRFYKPEDLKKIWGFPTGFYARVAPYIQIARKEFGQKKDYVMSEPRREKKITLMEVNAADSATWDALPGIGGKLSMRILRFREKLGGFYSVDQVGETFGLQDSVFQKIRGYLVVGGSVKKININTARKEELSQHPYIRWKLAEAIIAYRNQHGNFTELGQLKNIVLLDEKTFEKIVHYLEL